MIGVALALIVVGVGLFFLVPFVGIPIGAVGLLLAVLYLVGFGRRGAEAPPPCRGGAPGRCIRLTTPMALRDRLMRRAPAQADPGAGEAPQEAPPPPPAQQSRAPTPGQVRRERRALVRAREDRIRDLGGLMLEMYKRDRLKPELFFEQCAEIVSIEERIQELDGALASLTKRTMAEANRCTCGAPLVWGAHFCA